MVTECLINWLVRLIVDITDLIDGTCAKKKSKLESWWILLTFSSTKHNKAHKAQRQIVSNSNVISCLFSLFYIIIIWIFLGLISHWAPEKKDNRLLGVENNQKLYQAEPLPLPSSSHWPDPLSSTVVATSGTEMWNSIFLCPAGRGCSNTSEGCSTGPLKKTETITTPLNSSLWKVPMITLMPEQLKGWDILFWPTTDISQSTDMQPGDTVLCVHL